MSSTPNKPSSSVLGKRKSNPSTPNNNGQQLNNSDADGGNKRGKPPVTLYNFGYAPKDVIERFQHFCINFPTLTAAIENLLERDDQLTCKYRFISSSVTYQMLARPTVKDDPATIKQAILKLHKYAKDGRYKSVSDSIEELLMSTPNSCACSVKKPIMTTGIKLSEKEALEKITEAVYNKLIKNAVVKQSQPNRPLGIFSTAVPGVFSTKVIPPNTSLTPVHQTMHNRIISHHKNAMTSNPVAKINKPTIITSSNTKVSVVKTIAPFTKVIATKSQSMRCGNSDTFVYETSQSKPNKMVFCQSTILNSTHSQRKVNGNNTPVKVGLVSNGSEQRILQNRNGKTVHVKDTNGFVEEMETEDNAVVEPPLLKPLDMYTCDDSGMRSNEDIKELIEKEIEGDQKAEKLYRDCDLMSTSILPNLQQKSALDILR